MSATATPSSPTKKNTESDTVKVMVRMRLFDKRELSDSEKRKVPLRPCINMRGDTCAVMETLPTGEIREREAFQFNECFWSMPEDQAYSTMPYADQQHVYERSGRLALNHTLEGYNGCIFAYGQTGSGKTFTMLGNEAEPGVSPRLLDDLFNHIKNDEAERPYVKTTVAVTFFEVYNEKVRDLFAKRKLNDNGVPEYSDVRIRQHPTRGVYVDGLQVLEVASAAAAKRAMNRGTIERAMAPTKLNDTSSRSHAIFQIQVTQQDALARSTRVSRLNLVDLAGSEKVKFSEVKGERLIEATNINKSLMTLRKVIDVLIDNEQRKGRKSLAPYRESVLTYVLSDSLGGNSKTQMMATISPHDININETIGTLRYALRAKAIVCKATKNEEAMGVMVEGFQDEIIRLRKQLADKSSTNSPAAAAEIRAAIKDREEEIQKMEKTHETLVSKLDEFEENQRQLQADKGRLQIEVDIQKREKFASAFRNAFKLTAQRKKIELSHAETEALTQEVDDLKEERADLIAEVKETREELEVTRTTTAQKIAMLESSVAEQKAANSQLKLQQSNQQADITHLRKEKEDLSAQCNAHEMQKKELEKRIHRMQEELLSATTAIKRHEQEKEAMRASFEAQLQRRIDEAENLRKRKDKYKETAMAANAQVEAREVLVQGLQQDRSAVLTTLKVQHDLLNQQNKSVSTLFEERSTEGLQRQELERRLEAKEQDCRVLSEALREYQSATTDLIWENQKLSRQSSLAAHHHAATSPSPTRSVSPGVSRQASLMRAGDH